MPSSRRWRRRRTRRPIAGRLRLLVCGGSLGSPFLNRRVPELAAALREAGIAVEVWHQAGERALDEIRAAYAAAGIAARVDAHVDDMAAAYRWADVAVACAGAATLAELAAAGLPALLVPLAAASDDHQSDNAAAFAAATGAPWVREADWKPPPSPRGWRRWRATPPRGSAHSRRIHCRRPPRRRRRRRGGMCRNPLYASVIAVVKSRHHSTAQAAMPLRGGRRRAGRACGSGRARGRRGTSGGRRAS